MFPRVDAEFRWDETVDARSDRSVNHDLLRIGSRRAGGGDDGVLAFKGFGEVGQGRRVDANDLDGG
jgi:hypothetical protein